MEAEEVETDVAVERSRNRCSRNRCSRSRFSKFFEWR